MDKWMWSLISLASIFILISSTNEDLKSLMYLGLFFYALAGAVLYKFYKDKKNK
jgi:hypothetical protein